MSSSVFADNLPGPGMRDVFRAVLGCVDQHVGMG
jgi:hypothetical protein